MLVYDEDIKITGSIDMLYRKKNGEYAIFDWKRSKEIMYEGFRKKKSHVSCIRHLDDCNFWHYSLQLNIYRRILQKNYGLVVTDLRLVILHPNNTDYQCLIVPFLDSEIDALFQMRENEVKGIPHNNISSHTEGGRGHKDVVGNVVEKTNHAGRTDNQNECLMVADDMLHRV
jgi:hypothetical protein